MSKSNTKYSKRIIWIHWISTILIFGLIFTGITMENGEHNEFKFDLYRLHFTIGILVFVLTTIRIIGLIKDKKPTPLYAKTSIRQKFISFVHYGFYVTIIWMCISGVSSLFLEGIYPALVSSNFIDLPKITEDGFHPIMLSHHIVAKFVFLLLVFHIVGILIHNIQKKENIIKRIF